jgi:cell division protein ZapE
MFERGVTLVATSNIPPDALYADGLQRARFLPAIHQIQKHTLVQEMNGPVDYRLRTLEQAAIYYHPADAEADRALANCFARLSPEACLRDEPLEVLGRIIPTRRRADGVAWFDFTALCEGPRSQADYIEIARAFHSVLVSSVPRLDDALANATRRFIALVDEFYDRNVKLILSAAAPVGQLYAGRRLAFEFRRTRSRLEEMQSHDYLARPHLP